MSSDYKNLQVWQRSMDLTTEVYRLVRLLPREELYGLSDQLRCAIVSVPSNIAEGQGRDSKNEFYHFLSIAYGSLCEVETQLEICNRLSFFTRESVQGVFLSIQEVQKMLYKLMQSLRTTQNS